MGNLLLLFFFFFSFSSHFSSNYINFFLVLLPLFLLVLYEQLALYGIIILLRVHRQYRYQLHELHQTIYSTTKYGNFNWYLQCRDVLSTSLAMLIKSISIRPQVGQEISVAALDARPNDFNSSRATFTSSTVSTK